MRSKRYAIRSITAERSQHLLDRLHFQFVLLATALAILIAMLNTARADENGVSFWIPGFFGSLAAVPQQQPGWTATSIYYHTDVSASGNAALSKEISIGQFNPTLNVNVNANVHAQADLEFMAATYVFATPFLGGQASATMLAGYGRNDTSLNGTIGGMLGPIPLPTRTVDLQQTTWGATDVIPQFAVRWNAGLANYMTYITGDVPVGLYHSSNLANMGLGHGAIDAGAGYTYFDPKTGHEFSAVMGFTGNFQNTSTNYTSGVDMHLDWGASQFLTKQVQVGLVGYVYNQITPDRGCAPVICPFESRVLGVGPQFGYIFPAGNFQGYVNVKAYREFDNNARPDGWNAWLTLSFSPAAPTPTSAKSFVTK